MWTRNVNSVKASQTRMPYRYCVKVSVALLVLGTFCFTASMLDIFKARSTRKPTELKQSNQEYDLRIIVIVYNRAASLLRLLVSLNNAFYENDAVKLEVWIDRSKDGNFDMETFQTANSFYFDHGDKEVIVHTEHVGIFGQWLTTWKPQPDSQEIAVILEDDLTVSPYFYKYLKLVHGKYDINEHVCGYALQGLSINHRNANSFLKPPENATVYTYPVLGTWGFSPSTRNWANFIVWYTEASKDETFEPIVPGNVVTSWYKEFKRQGKTRGMWSIWHVYYTWKHAEVTLYPNFGGQRGLTINWKEPGLHYSGKSKPSNPALNDWKAEYNLPDQPIHLDIDGHVVK